MTSDDPAPPPTAAATAAAEETGPAQREHAEHAERQDQGNAQRKGQAEEGEEEEGEGEGEEVEEGAESPPLPARHTAATPGPRATRLMELYSSSLSHTLARVSWDNFAACYPTIAAGAPGTLRAVQRQMVDRLEQLCQKEFEAVLAHRSVIPKLNELESLASSASRRRREQQQQQSSATPTPPPPPHRQPAAAVLDAHLAPHLAAQQGALNARLQTVQARNGALFDDVGRQRREMAALAAALARAARDVDAANAALVPLAGELARETRAVEAEMGGGAA